MIRLMSCLYLYLREYTFSCFFVLRKGLIVKGTFLDNHVLCTLLLEECAQNANI